MDRIDSPGANESLQPQLSSPRTDIFADVTDAQIAEYSALIHHEQNETRSRNGHVQGGNDSIAHLIYDPEFESIRQQGAYQTAAIPNNPIKDPQEAQKFANQVKALRHINASIDLTASPTAFIQRDYSRIEPVMRSVVRPLSLSDAYYTINNLLPEEETLHRFRVGTKIDRDCDQLRAMVKIFVTAQQRPFPGDKLYDERDAPYTWTLDWFRVSLKGVARHEFTNLLNYRGKTAGQASRIYQLIWEFFRKRELLGLELVRSGVEFDDGNASEHVGVQVENEAIGQETHVTDGAQDAAEGGREAGNEHGRLASAEYTAEVNGGQGEDEEAGSDEFHDARETQTLGYDLGSDFQSPAGETADHSSGASADPSGEEESDVEAEGDSEADDNQAPNDLGLFQDLDQPAHTAPSPLRKSKRGQTTHVEEDAEPAAPSQKRLRSGRA